MKNYYPDKPVIAFFSAKVEMGAIIDGIKAADCQVEVKRSAYIIIRNETGNGKSVVNGTNPGGVQSDSGQWPDKWTESIVATSIKAENRTGNQRGFVVFNSLQTGIAFMCERIEARGLYIGGTTSKITHVQINDVNDLATAYYREWVTGDPNYKPIALELSGFDSMYNQAIKIFT